MFRRSFSLVVGMLCLFSLAKVEVKAEEFSCSMGKEIVLKSGGATFYVNNPDGRKFMWLYVEGVKGMHLMGHIGDRKATPPRDHYFRGGGQAKLVVDENERKVVVRSTRIKGEYKLELTFEIKKDLPCLFVKHKVTNISEQPLLTAVQVYLRKATRFAADGIAIQEFVRGWQSVRPTPAWIYYEISKNKGLGIMPEKKNTRCCYYCGQKDADGATYATSCNFSGIGKTLLEEGLSIAEEFVIYPAKSPDEAKDIYEKIKEKIEPTLI